MDTLSDFSAEPFTPERVVSGQDSLAAEHRIPGM